LFAIALYITGADIGVVGFERLDDVAHGEVHRREPIGPGRHVILPDIAADGVHFGDAGRRTQLRADHPILQGAEVFRRPRRSVGFARAGLGLDHIHEDFAETRGDRAHFRLDTGGQLRARALQPFVDQLAGKIDVGAVLEDGRHLTEAVARDGARVLEPRQAGDRRLHGEGDPLFGFERRKTWRL
jgi:hypothetical protein